MRIDMTVLLAIIVLILLLSFLKAEKLVKVTFGSYVMLAFSMALGTVILQWAAKLNGIGSETILGISYSSIADFFTTGQPTIMLIFYCLGLWFFYVNSHLTIQFSSEIFEKKLQTLIWGGLCLGSILTSIYFSLGYFKGDLYEKIFNSDQMVLYSQWIPTVALIVALLTLLAASHLNIKILFKKSEVNSI